MTEWRNCGHLYADHPDGEACTRCSCPEWVGFDARDVRGFSLWILIPCAQRAVAEACVRVPLRRRTEPSNGFAA